MKTESEIKTNLFMKIGIWMSGVASHDKERLKEHIRILDWVLIDGQTRNIEEIIEHWKNKAVKE